MRLGLVVAVGGALCCQSAATIVNISTLSGANPVEVTVGPLKHVGVTLALGAGSYTVTPIDVAGGGAYTAANRFSVVDLPNRGWEWNVYVSTDGGLTGVKHGYGEGIPAQGGTYQGSAAAAFAAAPAPFVLTYGSATNVTFYWRDDHFGDNTGGLSLSVTPVPEPVTMGLAGLALVVGLKRRRRAVV